MEQKTNKKRDTTAKTSLKKNMAVQSVPGTQ